jgi:hypothetical protein
MNKVSTTIICCSLLLIACSKETEANSPESASSNSVTEQSRPLPATSSETVLSGEITWHSPQQSPPVHWMQTTAKDEAVLNIGEKLVSVDGKYTLFMQSDGNLVLYPTSCFAANDCNASTALWDCLKGKKSADGPHHADLQWDGNLVVYRGAPGTKTPNDYVCDTKTNVSGGDGDFFLWLNSDPNLIIYRGTPAKNAQLPMNAGLH